MNGKAFFDTNILVYALWPFDAERSATAHLLLLEGIAVRQGVVSYQVVQEFLNLALHKFNTRLMSDTAAGYLQEVVGGLKVLSWSMGLMKSGVAVAKR